MVVLPVQLQTFGLSPDLTDLLAVWCPYCHVKAPLLSLQHTGWKQPPPTTGTAASPVGLSRHIPEGCGVGCQCFKAPACELILLYVRCLRLLVNFCLVTVKSPRQGDWGVPCPGGSLLSKEKHFLSRFLYCLCDVSKPSLQL